MSRKSTLRYHMMWLARLCQLWLIIFLMWPSVTLGQKLILTPSLSVGARYDDNVFQDEGNTQDDFITVFTPQISLVYRPSATTRLNFRYSPSFEFFTQNSAQDQVIQRLSLNLSSQLSRRLLLRLSEVLTITEEPRDRDRNRATTPEDLAEDVPAPEDDDALRDGLRDDSREIRDRTIRNRGNFSLGVQLAPRTSLGLFFGSLFEDVEDPDEVDEFRYNVGANVGYLTSIARGNRVSLTYNVAFFTFNRNAPVAPTDPNPPNDADFRVQTVSVGYLHNFSRTLTANAAFGYSFTNSDNDNLDGNSGLVGRIAITKSLSTGAASIGYTRQITSGRGQGDQVQADNVFVTFATRLSPKVTARLNGNVSLFNFEGDNAQDRLFFTLRPSLTYDVLRFWRLTTAYSYEFTNFDESNMADRTNHRLTFTSLFILRQGLSIGLTYGYRARRFDGETTTDEFDRNEFLLTLAYSPTLRLF